jgi:drug/metabolite transporter (DMT)-like permease
MKVGPPPSAPPLLILAVYAALALIWGTTWLAIKVSLEYLPPFFSIAVRFLVAGFTIIIIMKLRGEKIPWEPRHQPFFIMLGILSFVVSYGIVYWGEQYITSGLTAVIFALLPLFTGIVAHFLLERKEPLGIGRLIGLIIGLGGIVVINAADLTQLHPMAPLAAVLIVLSPISTAFSTVISKRRMEDYTPLAFAGMPMLYGGLINIPLWLIVERHRSISWAWEGIAATAYLTVLGSVVTFIGYFWLLRRMEVNRANLLAYITPVVALAVGHFFAGETLTPFMLLGSILVLTGVAVANRARNA